MQGMLNAVVEVISHSKPLMSLWKHECTRVFADRFTTQEDKDWFERTIKQVSDFRCISFAVLFYFSVQILLLWYWLWRDGMKGAVHIASGLQ